MAIDVDGARRAVERFLDDELLIWRDSGGRSDDLLDESTGVLVARMPDATLIWSGRGVVMPVGRASVLTPPVDGAAVVTPSRTDYQVVIPVTAPPLKPDDVVKVAGSARAAGPRDPQLIGRRFRVADATVGTFTVVRVVRLQVID